jgi:hypothetical protein
MAIAGDISATRDKTEDRCGDITDMPTPPSGAGLIASGAPWAAAEARAVG